MGPVFFFRIIIHGTRLAAAVPSPDPASATVACNFNAWEWYDEVKSQTPS
uniref:Uncharacterized protein n=1 Tax=Setaria viridis TaxID=4556 RepID=A0A4U6T172_SETVI|nr:hypothetical protein SEVIR_9G314950v2 [Setaria viridis]